MRKVKPYNFKGVDCYDLNSLAEEYIKSYFEAMDDIFTNAKGLISFVKRCRKDKAFTKEIAQILYTSKYKNNALTFIIFAFTGYGRIIVNGVEMSFKQFIEAFKEHKEKENNVLYAFLEDAGITKTYANVLHDERLSNEAAAIEGNYDLDFTRLYLEGYYSYKETQSFENRVSNLILANEECYRKATELCRTDAFMLAVAHKIGFKEAVAIHKERNPLFESVKLLKKTNEFQDEELLKLITDTFYWWLLDNIDRYVPKSKDSKRLFERIYAVQKKYKKYEDLIKKKKIYDLALESMADMSKEMYSCYLDFVVLYRNDQIVVKKKFKGGYDYVFDKPYCGTYITQSYMDGRIITLEEIKEEVVEEEEITPEVLEDAPIDEPVDGEDKKKKEKKPKKEKPKKEKMSKKDKKKAAAEKIEHLAEESPADELNIPKLRKKNAKSARGRGFVVFELILIIIAAVALVTVTLMKVEGFNLIPAGPDGSAEKPIYIVEPIFYGVIGGVVLLIILLPIMSSRLKKAYRASINLEYILNTKKVDALTVEQEKKLNKLKPLEEKNAKQVSGAKIVLSSLILASLAVLISALTLVLLVQFQNVEFVAQYHLVEKLVDKGQPGGLSKLSTLYPIAAAAGVGLVYGFIKKYKGILSILLVDLLAIVATVGVLFLLP